MSNFSDHFVPDNLLHDLPRIEAEMAEAFQWDVPPTDAELEAQYAAQRCDEEEVLVKHPSIQDEPDQELIEMVTNSIQRLTDADEAAAAALIVLQRRLDGVVPHRPG